MTRTFTRSLVKKLFVHGVLSLLFVSNALAQVPAISAVSPLSGAIGTPVIITGTNFNATAANNIVFFGAAKATVSTATATTLTVTVPVGATYAPITVLNTGTTLAAYSAARFTPTFTPNAGHINTTDMAAQVSFATGVRPRGAVIRDIDGDGKPDVVVVNNGDNTVSILRNTGTLGTPGFAPLVTYATGAGPVSVAVGDIDGDGKPDLAIPGLNDNTVSVLLNTSTAGTVSFAPGVVYAAGASPRYIAIGDIDSDGKPDLAITSTSENAVSILRNTGSIGVLSFATRLTFATGTFPNSVSIGDIDGDGKPDVFTTNLNNNSVLLNTSSVGTPNFAAPITFTAGTNPQHAAIGDIDGDGKSDVVVANIGNGTASVLRNTSSIGAISFATELSYVIGVSPMDIAIADIDGDSKPDLAVAYAYGLAVLRNTGSTGNPGFSSGVNFNPSNSPTSSAIGDMDGDGKPDLVTSNGDNTISVFRNTPVVPPTPTITLVAPLNGAAGTPVNITGTNFNTTAANNVVFFGATKATVNSATATTLNVTVPAGATYAPITVLNTGTTLAAYSAVNFIPTYTPNAGHINTSDIAPQVTHATGRQPLFVTMGDLDGDGKSDLVIANSSSDNTVSVLLNTGTSGSPGFAPQVTFATGAQPYSVAISDINGDGKLDLVVANMVGGTVSVLRNTSSGGNLSFATQVTFATGSSPYSVVVGDVDGDGKPDIVTANNGNSTVSVLRNTGSLGIISFATQVAYATVANPIFVAIGDLDGDGKPDLVTGTNTSNAVGVLRNTGSIGSPGFAASISLTTATGSSPTTVAIGDIDGEGKPDLVTSNFGGNSVSVLRNTGSLNFAAQVSFPAGNNPIAVAIGDIDGDGKPDLAVANLLSTSAGILRNTSTAGTPAFGAVAAYTIGAFPQSVAIGDIDSDGKPDIIAANFNNNTVSVLRNAPVFVPAITAVNNVAALFTVPGRASVSGPIIVSGAALSEGVLVTPPAGFEVSLNNVVFTPTVILGSAGALSATNVYIRLAAATPVGNYAGNMVLASGSITTNVALIGSEVNPPPAVAYSSPHVYAANNAISPLSPQVTGVSATAYSPLNVGPAFKSTSGIAVDVAGNIYVANANSGLLNKIPFGSSNAILINTGFTTISAVAVDASGNLYVTDGNTTLKKIPVNGGAPIVLTSTLAGPYGLAVDGANVYITDASNKAYKIPVNGGALTTIATGLNNPNGITIDAAGNIYIADTNNSLVKVIPASGGAVYSIGTGLRGPAGVAVDASGNVYVTDSGNSLIKKIPAGNGTPITIGTGIISPFAIAINAAGDVFTAGDGSNAAPVVVLRHTGGYEISPALPAGLSFDGTTGTITGTPTTVTAAANYTVTAYGPGGSTAAIANIAVLNRAIASTGRLSGLVTVTGTASASGTFNVSGVAMSAGILVTPPAGFEVSADNITFTPTVTIGAAGTIASTPVYIRLTAANTPNDYFGNIVLSSSGATNVNVVTGVSTVNPLPPTVSYESPKSYVINTTISALAPVTTGVAATPYSAPANLNTVGINGINGIATDAAGNIYIANYSSTLIKIPFGTSTPETLATGLEGVSAVALDAAGNIYITDGDASLKKIPAGGGAAVTFTKAFSYPAGIAVDAANIYVTDFGGKVYKMPIGGGAITTMASGLNNPNGVAVDAAGNIYVAETNANLVKKIPAAGGTPVVIGSGIGAPSGVAVDAFNNVYVTDYLNSLVKKIPAAGGTPVSIGSGITRPFAIAINAAGDVYTASNNNNSPVIKIKHIGGFEVVPALPAGLSLDVNTGIINGTPTAISPAANYTVTAFGAGGSATAVVNITLKGHVITASGTLSALTTTYGAPSASGTFNVSGAGMSAGILVTPPTGFEVSTDNVTFAPTVTIGAAGTIPTTPVYIRLAAANIPNDYSGNVVLSSADATSVNVPTAASTVSKAALTVTANDQAKNFGAALPAFTVSYTGFVNGDNADGLITPPTISTTADVNSPAGTYVIIADGATSNKYTLTYVPGVLTVTAIGQTITFAPLPNQIYGAVDFAPGATSNNASIGITYSSDNAAVATIVNGMIHVVGAGSANIKASQAGNGNYTAATDVIQPVTVNKAPLAVKASNASKVYGAVNPALAVTYTGFVGTDNAASLATQPAVTTGATTSSAVGTYPITANGGESANYTFTYSTGNLTVTPATLTINATNATKTYGAANPTLAITYAGFVNGDNAASLTTQPTVTTSAVTISPVGAYAISASGAVSSNYTFAYNLGTLIVSPAVLTVTAGNATRAHGVANPAIGLSYSGFIGTDNASVLATAPTVTTTATIASLAGTYPTIAAGGVGANYTFTYLPGVFTITASGNANLTGLTVSAGTLSPAFATVTTAYTVSVANSVGAITITPVAADATAVIKVNGNTVTGGSASGNINLIVGANVITTEVTAQDGVTKVIYTTTVTRAQSTNAALSGIGLSEGSLSPIFSGSIANYSAIVANNILSIRLTPTAADAGSVITVNGVIVNNRSASGAISLNVGDNTITTVVTAQDGVTKLTYTVIVRRGAAPDAIIATNIMSPDGDGVNDNWVIKDIALYPNNVVTVYDRGGRIVFTKRGYNNEWQATLGGAPLAEDTYYYAVDLGVGTKPIVGFITIVRPRK